MVNLNESSSVEEYSCRHLVYKTVGSTQTDAGFKVCSPEVNLMTGVDVEVSGVRYLSCGWLSRLRDIPVILSAQDKTEAQWSPLPT